MRHSVLGAPISPLGQRQIDDMTLRRFSQDAAQLLPMSGGSRLPWPTAGYGDRRRSASDPGPQDAKGCASSTCVRIAVILVRSLWHQARRGASPGAGV